MGGGALQGKSWLQVPERPMAGGPGGEGPGRGEGGATEGPRDPGESSGFPEFDGKPTDMIFFGFYEMVRLTGSKGSVKGARIEAVRKQRKSDREGARCEAGGHGGEGSGQNCRGF